MSSISRYLHDPVHGGWFYRITLNGKLIGGAKASAWKADCHTWRALLSVPRMLGRIEPGPPPIKVP